MKPLLVTMGDAAGIGPEICVQASAMQPGGVLVGDVAVLRRALRQCALQCPLVQLDAPDEAPPPGAIAVWQPAGLPEGLVDAPQGRVSAACGAAAARCIEAAVAAIQQGQGAALVTAPLHKEALHLAGSPYPGHTEMLQALAGGAPVRMMLANRELRVVLVTVHLALREAIEQVRCDRIVQTLQIADQSLRRLGLAAPRLAVAGLNPHAGEGGLFGREEIEHIAPAVAAARAQGIDASGPHPPDTVFMRARQGAFDAVVAMTHDHGLIPVKYLGLDEGVNVTLGLPFLRTSPDHGTAFDIAGTGRASPASLLAAWRMAQDHFTNQALAGSSAAS